MQVGLALIDFLFFKIFSQYFLKLSYYCMYFLDMILLFISKLWGNVWEGGALGIWRDILRSSQFETSAIRKSLEIDISNNYFSGIPKDRAIRSTVHSKKKTSDWVKCLVCIMAKRSNELTRSDRFPVSIDDQQINEKRKTSANGTSLCSLWNWHRWLPY